MKRTTLAALAALAAGPAFAASEETRLFESGRWGVDHVAFDDGHAACRMSSSTATDLVFFWMDTDGAYITAGSNEWAAAPRAVEIEIRIDSQRWEASAKADGRVIFVPALRPEFLLAVKNGRELSIVSASGRNLLTYSLEGSGAGIATLLDCWSKLPASPVDPFADAPAPADVF